MNEGLLPAGTAVLIPGGGGGAGQAIAAALGDAGLRPVLLGRSKARLEEACEVLRAANPDLAVHARTADVTDRIAMEAAVAWTADKVGPPLALVNAAGIAESAPLLPPDDGLWERTLSINATGAWIAATACLPAMRAAEQGFVAHIASTAALEGYRYTAAYVASKHAMLGLSRALTADLAKSGIRVVTLCPGFLDTPMTARTVQNMVEKTGMSEDEARAALGAMNAGGRLITPAEVAAEVRRLYDDPDAHGAEVRLD